jgi:hypothetical protein
MSGMYMCAIQFFAKQGLCDDDEAVGTRHIVKLNLGEKEASVILRRYLFNGKKSEHSTFWIHSRTQNFKEGLLWDYLTFFQKSKGSKVVWRNAQGVISCPGGSCPKNLDDTCPIYLNTLALMAISMSQEGQAIPPLKKHWRLLPISTMHGITSAVSMVDRANIKLPMSII